jgi:SAM-dependent MidA family methyltransferase
MEKICQSPWGGLFIAFDYGLERDTVFNARPQGTGRTYAGHQMGAHLLENPGERDITCHLIWEELQEILTHWEFTDIHLQRQEAFFMHHAGDAINRMIEAAPPGFSREKQTLMQLLHPDNMGHKFQVLHARRGEF